MTQASWMFAVLVACVFSPEAWALCWDRSVCRDLSSKENLLDCLHLCALKMEAVSPLGLRVDEEDALLDTLLSGLDVKALGVTGEAAAARDDRRRSYSMEHFRWGKPPGRKRRPIKVYASSLEAGDSFKGGFHRQVRRQLGGIDEEEVVGGGSSVLDIQHNLESQEGAQGVTFGPKSSSLLGSQEMKDGTYRMSHFRWGRPPATKRYGFTKPWE